MNRSKPLDGSVALMALCCVTVLGIALASYLAVSNQAMQLSNRAYAQDVSRHLAEMGLERALRSFTANTFSSWTLSGITANLAAPIAISTGHYGNSGVTTAINVRVYHYRDTATNKATSWSILTTYSANDFVYYQGNWYLCTMAPTSNQAPSNTTYWENAPAPWLASATYQIGNIALSGNSAYRCKLAHANQSPPNSTYWDAYSVAAWNSGAAYSVDDVVLSGGAAYRCIAASSNNTPPNTTYWLSAPIIYSEGVATLPNGTAAIKTQLKAYIYPAPLFTNAAGAAIYTNMASSGTVDSYNSNVAPYVGATATNYSAIIAGGNTSGTAVSIGSVNVKGYVAAPSATTAPFAPLWNYSGSASLIAPPPASSSGIDPTRVSRSPFVPQYDIQSVTAANFLSVPSTTTTNLPAGGDTISADGKYYYYTNTDIFLSSGTLNINAPVVIDIRPSSSADLWIQNTGKIVITNNPTASLEIHFGDELYLGSNSGGGIQNLTLDPKRCILLGTSTYNSSGYHYFWSNLPFYGVIYMPNAYLHFWNSGYNEQIYGAISASNIYFNHTTNLHYDLSLRTAAISGVDVPYIIRELRELTDPSERITLP